MKFPPIQLAYWPLDGGADYQSPPMQVSPGNVIESHNFECDINGGYRRIEGYEHVKVDLSWYSIYPDWLYKVRCSMSDALAVNDVLRNAGLSKSYKIIYIGGDYVICVDMFGSMVGPDEGEYLYKTGDSSHNLTALADGILVSRLSGYEKAFCIEAALAWSRVGVTSLGSVAGLAYFNNVLYATTSGVLKYFSTGAFLTFSQPAAAACYSVFQQTVAGTPGSTTLSDGVDSATSSSTYIRSGSWAGGNAVVLIMHNAGAPGEISTTGAGAASYGGVAGTITRTGTMASLMTAPGEFAIHDFGSGGTAGASSSKYLFMVSGSGPCLAFNGTMLIPVLTGMTTDTPSHVCVYKNHLFLSYSGVVQHSSIGNPFAWSVVTGAGELVVGDTVTAMKVLPGGDQAASLAIFARHRTVILYGNSSADWSSSTSTGLTVMDETVGARAKSVQHIGRTIVMDDLGLTTLETSSNFGNFIASSISLPMRQWVTERVNKVTCSMVCRKKNQYRVFFSDGTGLYVTVGMDGKYRLMPVKFPAAITACVSSEDTITGKEVMYVASNSYVYRLDNGWRNFAGQSIPALVRLAYNAFQSPRTLKQFRKAAVEVSGSGYATFSVQGNVSYGGGGALQPSRQTFDGSEEVVTWGNFQWDNFTWDGRMLTPDEVELTGIGENLSIKFMSNSKYDDSVTLHGVMVHYTPRRNMR